MQRILGVNLLVCFANNGCGSRVIVLFSDSTIATKIFGVLLYGLLFLLPRVCILFNFLYICALLAL